MLAVFRQTYKKLLFKPSTLLFLLFVAWIFGMDFSDTSAANQHHVFFFPKLLRNIFYSIVSTFDSFFTWFLLPIFVSVKSVGFIADEIEDGSLLTVLSKPITRTQLLIEKFLALEAVIVSFILSSMGIIWFFAIKAFPFGTTWGIMLKLLFPMFMIAFTLQLFLSILLIVLSMKVKPGLLIGIGTLFATLSLLAPVLIDTVAKNMSHQEGAGSKLTAAEYDGLTKGQKKYQSFLKYIYVPEHFRQLYFKAVIPVFKPYNLDSLAIGQYNKEVLATKTKLEDKDKLGNVKSKVGYIVSGYKDWFTDSSLIISYSIGSILILLFGFRYFTRKDIV